MQEKTMNKSKAEIFHFKYPWGSEWCGIMLFRGKKNILIDTAVAEALPFLEEKLSELGLTVKDIDIIANTHSHGDHIGLNNIVSEISGAEILNWKNGLQDGEVIDGGNYTLQVFHTPGHSADSISFFESSNKVLFTGDAFEGRGSRYGGVALYNDPQSLLKSVEKIRKVVLDEDVKTMYLSHSYHGTCGVLVKNEIPVFLNTCRDTILAYNDLIKSLPEDISVSDAALELRKHFGITDDVLQPKAAESTARAHLAYIGR